MPSLAETKAALEVEKLEREIKKIRRDTLFVPLGFAAQLFNSIGIIGLGLLILLVFQRPQISEQEKSRIATEKFNITNFMLLISQIQNQESANKATKVLAGMYPHDPVVADFAKSDDRITIANEFINQSTAAAANAALAPEKQAVVKPKKADCDLAESNLRDLNNSISALTGRLDRETEGLGIGPKGLGPMAKSLKDQISRVNYSIAQLKQFQVENGCVN